MTNYTSKPALDPNFVPDSERLFSSYSVNRVAPEQIKVWLQKSVADIKANPLASLFYGVVFAVVGVLVSLIEAKNPAFLVAAQTGFLLVSPLLALGLYDLSRQREQAPNQPSNLMASMLSLRHNMLGLGLYSIALGALIIFWVRLAAIVTGVFFNSITISESGGYGEIFSALFRMEQGWIYGLIFFGVGLLFAVVAFVSGVVTAQLLLDKKIDIITAAVTSIRVVLKNPVTMLIWAITIMVITAIGLVSYDIGLIITMPLIAHASWHAYRDLVNTQG